MTTETTTYTPDETSASLAVLEAVAERKNADPLDLPPLYDLVDPDALDAVFEPAKGDRTSSQQVEFTYDGYRVTVSLGNGALTVETDATTSRSDATERRSEYQIN